MKSSASTKVFPNTNRAKDEPSDVFVSPRSAKDKSQKVWTGQRVLTGGRLNFKPPSDSRVAKEALYRTGSSRVWQRRSGTGRTFKEKPKKSGAGGHNWGFPGMEVGVELATNDELREIEREFNPTAPDSEEEPIARQKGAFEEEGEEWADEQYLGDDSGHWSATDLSGWEGMIAGNALFPGYEQGIESIRTLWGDEPVSDEYFAGEEERFARLWISKERESQQEEEGERRVALTLGGPPKWSEEVRWGDQRARKSVTEGVPVIPWGESLPKTMLSGEPVGFAPGAATKTPDGLPEQGYAGLEAELTAGRGSSLDANFANREIRTEIKFSPRAAAFDEEASKLQGSKSKAQQGAFNISESVSLPSA